MVLDYYHEEVYSLARACIKKMLRVLTMTTSYLLGLRGILLLLTRFKLDTGQVNGNIIEVFVSVIS